MGKHTPGPWQSMHDFDLAGEFSIVGNVDGEIIDGHTHHSYTLVAEIYDNDNLAEDRANARLIAAAPELLEILRTVIFGDPNCNFQFMMAGNPNAQDKFLAEANALLSRIEGDA